HDAQNRKDPEIIDNFSDGLSRVGAPGKPGAVQIIFRELMARGTRPAVAQQVAANSGRWLRNSGILLNSILPIKWADQLELRRLA
ncbi:hypothetical protein ACFTIK_22855, partial [Tistrella mobilis]|uniref:hypothetical protein n=1 Tax=Tistrella mobilis TaxID=171437 RepID=UPI00362F2302